MLNFWRRRYQLGLWFSHCKSTHKVSEKEKSSIDRFHQVFPRHILITSFFRLQLKLRMFLSEQPMKNPRHNCNIKACQCHLAADTKMLMDFPFINRYTCSLISYVMLSFYVDDNLYWSFRMYIFKVMDWWSWPQDKHNSFGSLVQGFFSM